jgi:predicted dehydrogenase
MSERRIGIIMHGVTGRMGTNQHLVRSILAIRAEGGVMLADGTRLMPDPILVGRSPARLEALADAHGLDKWSVDLDAVLEDPAYEVFFDAASTQLRASLLEKAIAAGRHVYCEKPIAATTADAVRVWRRAEERGIRHGVVQDKLWLPGLLKLQRLIRAGFFGRILSVKGDFGYWVFEGDWQEAQRPSWNYRKADGGGIILDMLCHWRYVLDTLFGEVQGVFCLGANHIPERVDEGGRRYAADADDGAYAIFALAGGIIAQINSSWCTRVRRDDLAVFQVDGTHGSAVAGLTRCFVQPRVATPRPVWNPDAGITPGFHRDWQEVPDNQVWGNAFKAQWTLFLRHVAGDLEGFRWSLREGAKGVQLAELGLESWRQRRMLDVPPLES